MGTDR
jgi:hypothetical protein